MVLSGRSAHDGRAEYSGTLLMKMEVRWASEREKNGTANNRVREVFGAIVWTVCLRRWVQNTQDGRRARLAQGRGNGSVTL